MFIVTYSLTAAMEGLAERLEGAGSFNIEVVITPFKDLISEAIMEYHGSSSKTISDKVNLVYKYRIAITLVSDAITIQGKDTVIIG